MFNQSSPEGVDKQKTLKSEARLATRLLRPLPVFLVWRVGRHLTPQPYHDLSLIPRARVCGRRLSPLLGLGFVAGGGRAPQPPLLLHRLLHLLLPHLHLD